MKLNTTFKLFLLLVVISSIIYIVQLLIFKSPNQTGYYFLQDLAFMPLHVAIVSLILDGIISARERKERLRKMNMAINAFFGEAGTDLVLMLNTFLTESENFKTELEISGKWNDKDFQKAVKMIKKHDFKMNSRVGDIVELKTLLIAKRPFLLTMLENSNLLEHDTFTDMLWAVFHITDELVARESLIDLPGPDLDHLSLDIKRAYVTLLVEWVHYIEHLQTTYPYLFSMAVRKNPFDDNRSIIFR